MKYDFDSQGTKLQILEKKNKKFTYISHKTVK